MTSEVPPLMASTPEAGNGGVSLLCQTQQHILMRAFSRVNQETKLQSSRRRNLQTKWTNRVTEVSAAEIRTLTLGLTPSLPLHLHLRPTIARL